MLKSLKITNIRSLVGSDKQGKLKKLSSCDILIKNGTISKIGQNLQERSDQIYDAQDKLITPAFVDPHTHVFPSNDRSNEFAMRTHMTYQEIAQAGGGILSSVKSVRNSSFDQIYETNAQCIKRFIAQGTLTLEMKSGYGLDTENEIKLLKVINKLKTDFKDYIDIVPTFLGAHAFPPEYKNDKDKYIDLICKEMIPAVAKEKLAEYIDSFCEIGYFSVDQTEKMMNEAKKYGMKIRLHADEFQDSGAAELAAKLGAHSADHLMAVSNQGIQAMAKNKVVATMLPGTTIFLGLKSFAPVRKMIDAGCIVALATDHNPGSSNFNSMPLMMNFAMANCKLSLEEAFIASTRNSSLALDIKNGGIIEEGAKADFLIWDFNDIAQIPYYHSEYLIAEYDHAPKRTHTLTANQRKQAIINSLKYFNQDLHAKLAEMFSQELDKYGHIYMFNYMPRVPLHAIQFEYIPGRSKTAKAMTHMILNNLDPQVAQFPQELITYGSNGAVFSNWAQFHLTLKYLRNMNDRQCLAMYSGHPAGLFPKGKDSPHAVITNGMMIPIFSDQQTYDNLYAQGVTMYGQMTAGSWMYIGPQGIIHGTAITISQAAKLSNPYQPTLKGKLFITSGLGGMSGAQPKATKIGGGICVVAEINEKALTKRKNQGYLDEVYSDLDELMKAIKDAKSKKEPLAIGYLGNVVDLWEKLATSDVQVDIGSDQTSLHNPYHGGYFPVGLTFEQSQEIIANDPQQFKKHVQESLRRQIAAINKVVAKDQMYFFDYGNAFLYEAQLANADVLVNGQPRYKSYVEDILGPSYFDYGFGPYRWVCTSALPEDLQKTDKIALRVLQNQLRDAPDDIQHQLNSNINWIKEAQNNNLVVGSQARILYSDTIGRIELATQMNLAIKFGEIKDPIVIGRDHHDVSGTDAPLRETSNIYDGSNLTADMATQNVIGDAMRGASWVSIHNGGGTGWGKAINGGFGLVLDGTPEAEKRAKSMLFWDVANGLTRRARAGNVNAIKTINRLKEKFDDFSPFIPSIKKE